MLPAVFKKVVYKLTSAIILSKAVGRKIQSVQFKQASNRFAYSTSTPSSASLASSNVCIPTSTDTSAEKEKFMSVFPYLVKDITKLVSIYDNTHATEWLTRAIFYNVPKGKHNRGVLTVTAYKSLMAGFGKPVSDEQLSRVCYLGWCVEMLQALFLIADDIMDHSETRRGQPCWYKVQGVGMIAINDSLMLENTIYAILKQQFNQTKYYVSLVELFHEAMLVTTVGESLDLQMAKQRVDEFSMKRYSLMVHNKTAFYSFYLPVASAMLMAGFEDAAHFQQAKHILNEIGYFFQVQDDFLDCFGDPEVTGKIGTDIQDNKCSWFATLAMERGDADDQQIMRDCYGKTDIDKVDRVKQLYEKLGLAQFYATYEEQTYSLIKQRIQELPKNVPHGIFYLTMDNIYQRDH